MIMSLDGYGLYVLGRGGEKESCVGKVLVVVVRRAMASSILFPTGAGLRTLYVRQSGDRTIGAWLHL